MSRTSKLAALGAGVALFGLAACSNGETTTVDLPEPATTTATYGECAQQYAVLVMEILQDPNVTAEQEKTWRMRAAEGASAASAGDPGRALELCQETVAEMQKIANQ
jgi:hypothetical protein